jgi:dihydrofolate synthase/folylpolyglutamate synthase
MEELLGRVGNPQLTPRSIHIAGTKGKGSTAVMIASALTAAGYRTGLYTSPHLHTFRERIRIDGVMISEEDLASIATHLQPEVDVVNERSRYGELTTFEILTALAFVFFAEQRVDFQVLETGLGGRLDATNVIRPRLCVITSVSLDHTEVLGDTLAKIAGEKAGIIKPGAIVVSAPQEAEAGEVIRQACARNRNRLVVVGRDILWRKIAADLDRQTFEVESGGRTYRLKTPLLGAHQLENAATAVAALEAVGIDIEHIARGLSETRWPGRLQVLRREPLLVVDGAHNGESAMRLREALREYFIYKRLLLIIGVSSDKDLAGMLHELAPLADVIIVTRSRHPRALSLDALVKRLGKNRDKTIESSSVADAIHRALQMAGRDDLICATGSLFVVAEAIEHVQGIAPEMVS